MVRVWKSRINIYNSARKFIRKFQNQKQRVHRGCPALDYSFSVCLRCYLWTSASRFVTLSKQTHLRESPLASQALKLRLLLHSGDFLQISRSWIE